MEHSTLVPDGVLTDVSHFIGNVLSGEKLSDVATQKRENVLKRLTVYVAVPATNQYLDMNAGGNKGSSPALQIGGFQATVKNEYVGADNQVWEEEEYEECPAEMENYKIEQQALEMQANIVNNPIVIEDTVKMQRTASELRTISSKSGPLLRKERKFFMDQFRRCWAAVFEGSLYIYPGEGASKPACVTELEGYKARALPDLTKDAKRRDSCFELVCPGKKTFQLVARTAKDMQQWVAIICNEGERCPTLPTRRQLPSIPCDEDDDEYDDVGVLRAQRDDDPYTEEIYDDIKFTENSDDDSIYDDIGEIYPKSVFNNKVPDKAEKKPEPTQIEGKITAILNQETTEDEDFYDDIGDFMNKGPSETGILDTTIKDNKGDSMIKKKEETESKKEEIPEDEDIYDDIGAFTSKEDQDNNISKQNLIADIPRKKEITNIPNRNATPPLKKNPPVAIGKNKLIPELNSKIEIGKSVLKPVMAPKPTLKTTTPSGAGTSSGKNNIKNLVDKLEQSLQKK